MTRRNAESQENMSELNEENVLLQLNLADLNEENFRLEFQLSDTQEFATQLDERKRIESETKKRRNGTTPECNESISESTS